LSLWTCGKAWCMLLSPLWFERARFSLGWAPEELLNRDI
jgi:hypothetical protein